MRTKHTFLFTLLLGLAWAGFLFAYQNGPDPGSNGIFGPTTACNVAGCHVGNPLNAAGGTLNLTGLPAEWTPGQTYPLTITIQRTGALTYGFQFSAVSDTTNQQAGSLAKGGTGTDASRIDITPLIGGVRYAQHNQINSQLQATTTFLVNWTAPTNAGVGSVRFNLAANAGNFNQQPTGDFIYTRIDRISPAAAPPPDFSLSATPPTNTVVAGNGTTYTIGVTGSNGFSSNVNLSVSGLPVGATSSFNPGSVGAGATSTLILNTTAAVAAGTYPLTFTGTSGSLTHTASASLTVNAAPPVGVTVSPFTLANMGSSSSATNGSGPLGVGYARIQPTAGSTTPSGVEIIGTRDGNNILVSETGVPASPLMTSGRIFAEVNGPVNTGLAIANPNGQTANISFFFTDAAGTNSATRSTTIPANGQLARFLNEDPWLGGSNIQGTFSFTSDVPVSVIALRGFLNERVPSDFLISTLPVIDTSVSGPSGTQFVPHFATGDGWTTQVILINPSSAAMTGAVQLFDAVTGAPASVLLDGVAGTSANYSIAARSSRKIVVSGPVAGGSVRVVPTAGGPAPIPLVVFSYKPGAITLTEAGAGASAGPAFRMYVESSGTGTIQSGIAVANTTSTAINVTFELFRPDGSAAGFSTNLPLPASGRIAKFLAEIFPTLTQSFQGVLRISSSSPISVVGLRGRYNQRPQPDFLITTTPPTLESQAASSAELLFPQLVNGGGYTTQFILFSGSAGQVSAGNLRFFTTTGLPLSLSLSN